MMDLSRVDLNLLKIFDSVYRLRNLTEVAREVNLTQPAISHALKRLRETLNDRLFIRTATGLEPTTRSDELSGPVKTALAIIEDCLSDAAGFQPELCDREFRLLLSDVGEMIFVARMMRRLREHAPLARVTVLQASRTHYHAMLRDREADIAVGHLPKLNGSLKQRALFNDRWVVLRARTPDRPPAALTLDDYKSARHVVVDPPGTLEDPIENTCAAESISRAIALRLPHFFPLPSVILSSDLLATVPNSVAVNLRGADSFEVHELPFRASDLNVNMYWHLRQDTDPAHKWFRHMFVDLFAEQRVAAL
jgi:DNA-binding transcriptional LysR family regulator